MATRRGINYIRTNNADADFRAWAQFIHDTLTDGGWDNTADTGQIDLTTVAKPTVANEKKGYEIWAMTDDLQAVAPLVMRLDYGSAGAAATPGLWITVGKASNGAGVITDVIFDTALEMAGVSPLTLGFSSGTTANNTMFGSAGPSRFAFSLWFDNIFSGDAGGPSFGIERLRDEFGAENDDGFFIVWSSATGRLDRSKVVYYNDPPPPRHDGSFGAVIMGTLSTASWSTDVGVAVIYPLEGGLALPQSYNFVIVNSGDWRNEAEFDLFDERCGEDVHYRRMAGQQITEWTNLSSVNVIAMRWD